MQGDEKTVEPVTAASESADPTACGAAAGNGTDETSGSGGGVDETLARWVAALERRADAGDTSEGLPVLPPAPEGDAADQLESARRFHQADGPAAAELQPPGKDCVPALLFPFRDPTRTRDDYPLFLFAADAVADDRLIAPLCEVLSEAAETVVPEAANARILKDNLLRLEQQVRRLVVDASTPRDATVTLAEAGDRMIEELRLDAPYAGQLADDLGKLVGALPCGGSLLALSEQTPLALLMHAGARRAYQRQHRLAETLTALRNKLRDLLRTDRQKDTSGRRPEALGETMGSFGAVHVDAGALSQVLGPSRGLEPMEGGRQRRIEGVVATLDEYSAEGAQAGGPLMTVVAHGEPTASSINVPVDWCKAGGDGVCATASELFEEQAARYARFLGAARVARLELAGGYDPRRHDPLLEGFGWKAFTAEELLALPPILVLESAACLAGSGMLDLSRLLLSGRPIQVLVAVRPGSNPGTPEGGDELSGYRFELGYLGVSHREALVHQSSAARPGHMLDGLLSSLDATRTSLHVIASGLGAWGEAPVLGAWLHGAAALEGRAHPFFRYDPAAGVSWARRFDFDGNPAPATDWPRYELPCRTSGGDYESLSLAFTFADFALLEGSYRKHFAVLPPEQVGSDLITMDEYLGLAPQQAAERIPFVWTADRQGRLRRAVVSRRLAFACRDRLDYWRTLQELAGVRNEHVLEAVERERERLDAKFAGERQLIEQAHAAEIERIRHEEAGEAMRRLARNLLNTDVASFGAAVQTSPPAALVEETQAIAGEAVAEPALDEDDGVAEEPWIESSLCTSCNDCLDINGRLFVYNANKQAIIGDPTAGTFAELVGAAEVCPSRCIHPGMPLNAHETDLAALIERAKPFN